MVIQSIPDLVSYYLFSKNKRKFRKPKDHHESIIIGDVHHIGHTGTIVDHE